MLINLCNRDHFNIELDKIVSNCADLKYKEYYKYIVKAVLRVAKKSKLEQKEQFELNRDMLNLLLVIREQLLLATNSNLGIDKRL